MPSKINIWQEKTVETDGFSTASATIEKGSGDRFRLWYRVPSEHGHTLSASCDPFVTGTIFTAMQEASDVIVRGDVSPSLLRNIDEFQEAWMCWLPQRYTKIGIIADREKEQQKALSDRAVATFSGGVDSCFTVWRHKKSLCGRLRQNLEAGLVIHGFDIPLRQGDVYSLALKKAEKQLESVGMTAVPMATNFRESGQIWGDCHGAGIASCLMMTGNGYTTGLIASSSAYNRLHLPFGSNPVTDGLLSSNSFKIHHDGAAFIRREKIREISRWPEAIKNLRVCYEGEHHDRNCCRCEKCIRTILSFRVMGLGLPECFERDVPDEQIEHLTNLRAARLYYMQEILSLARQYSISESWVNALDKCLKKNVKALNQSRHPWNRIKSKDAVRTRLKRLIGLQQTA